MRNSWPLAAVALSMSPMIAPGSQTTRPGAIDRTRFISARLSTTPPGERHRLAVIAGAAAARRDGNGEAIGGGEDASRLPPRSFGETTMSRGDRIELALENRRIPVEVAALLAHQNRIVLAVRSRRSRGGTPRCRKRGSWREALQIDRVRHKSGGARRAARPARSTTRSVADARSSSVKSRARVRIMSAGAPTRKVAPASTPIALRGRGEHARAPRRRRDSRDEGCARPRARPRSCRDRHRRRTDRACCRWRS